MIDRNSKIYNTAIENIATIVQEKFREIYKIVNNGTKVKTTRDEMWIKKNGTDQFDLAKLKYFELPSEAKFERYAGAKIAFDLLLEATNNGRMLDDKFVEEASSIIHEKWLQRNTNGAEKEYKKTYESLSEEAKEKDRVFVYSAIEVFKTI